MKFKNKRFFSAALSIFIALTIIFSIPITNIAYGAENDVKDLFRQTLQESRKDKGVEIENNLPDAEEIVTFIVELDESSGKDLSRGKALNIVAKDEDVIEDVLFSQEYYMEEIKKINKEAVFSNQYTLVFNGFSVETKYGDKKKIEEIPGVKRVSLAKTYYRDIKNAVQITDIPYILENYGYDGRGKVVSVLDSGVDYNHKDMVISNGVDVKLTESRVNEIRSGQKDKRGKYFTLKVPFGYNYADKDEDIIDRVVGNIDYGHGMHVAGIIGANCQNEDEIKQNKGVKGIAPECQILAMKIFANNPQNEGASEADIIAAIEDSIAYGADVINMSFCSTAGFQNPDDGQQKAIQTAIDEGIIVVAAAGNVAYSTYPKKYDSVIDTGTVGAPGLARGSIQVASFENSKRTVYVLNANINGDMEKIPYILSDYDPVSLKGEYEVVDCDLGKVEDFNKVDAEGKIALIKRGEIEFKDKKLNAQKKGAVGVIIYNSDGEEGYLDYISTDDRVKIPTIFMKNSDGVKLKNMIQDEFKVSFDGQKIDVPNIDDGNMSYFTSWGPTPNLDLKPDITSVGGNIWSTVNDNEYKTMSGTSMAAPHTAGIMALILQHLDNMDIQFESPAEKVKLAKTMIMNTAEVKFDKESGLPYSPRVQGAGLINAKRALENQTILTYKGNPSIALGEIENITDISLRLYNGSHKDAAYNIELLCDKDVELRFDSNQITIPAGQALNIDGQLVLGDNVKKDSFVEGFIRFVSTSDHISSIGMPFLGFYGDWASLRIIDEPAYKEGSIFKETSLFTVDYSDFLAKTYKLGGEDMNPEYFAINPEDAKSNNNVLPQFSLLRNAKEMSIDVTDDNGEIIQVIEDRENMRKEVVIEQQIPAKVNFDWVWKGIIYDKNLGYKTPVDEGQYYINIRAKADFENAKEQILTLPIKIDKTPPTVNSGIFITDTDECTIEIEAGDKGVVNSGIENFLFLLDGKKYGDENGEFIFKLKEDEDGKYRMNIKLPEGDKKLIYSVDMGVTDHADNMAAGKANIIYSPKSNIQISTDKTKYSRGENIVVKYNLKEGTDYTNIHHYEICIDSLDNPIDNGKNTNYTIGELLKDGIHKIIIKAMDSNGETIDINFVEIEVEESLNEEEKLVVENMTDITSFVNGDDVSAKIKAANYYNDAKDIALIVSLYDKDNMLVNSAAVEKSIKPNKTAFLTSTIKVPDSGQYKIKIFVWDNFHSMRNLLPYMEIDQK